MVAVLVWRPTCSFCMTLRKAEMWTTPLRVSSIMPNTKRWACGSTGRRAAHERSDAGADTHTTVVTDEEGCGAAQLDTHGPDTAVLNTRIARIWYLQRRTSPLPIMASTVMRFAYSLNVIASTSPTCSTAQAPRGCDRLEAWRGYTCARIPPSIA